MLEKLYISSPKIVQNALLTTKGFLINRQRYSSLFDEAFEELQNNTFANNDELKSYQNTKFLKLLEHISQNKLSLNRFEALYGCIDKFSSVNDIETLPILSKERVKQVLLQFPIKRNSSSIIAHTSGTTGSGLVFPVSKISDAYQWAVWWRYRSMHGITFDTICGYFGGRSIVPANERNCFYRVNLAAKQIMFSAYHLNQYTLKSYVKGITSKNITWLHGYPSFLSHFASLCLENEIDISNQVEIITIGAESLLPQQKTLLETVFNCPVRQHYGLAEGVANISESREGNLIIDEDFCLCEFQELPENKNRLIGTNLYNHELPFIRYDTGDNVNLNVIETEGIREIINIDGRKEDFIVLADGTKVGRLDHIFKDILDVKEVQIIQNNFKTLDVLIVKSKMYTNLTEKKILAEFDKKLHGRVLIDIQYVNVIPKTKAGKLRFVISNIK